VNVASILFIKKYDQSYINNAHYQYCDMYLSTKEYIISK